MSMSLGALDRFLDPMNLKKWVNKYSEVPKSSKHVGLIMAGNIPLVGFHDLLCIYTTGHQAVIKLSHQDQVLLPALYQDLVTLDPSAQSSIVFTTKVRPSSVEAIIATGSDNTSRYIRYYYQDVPGIIRSNRTSVGILTGKESDEQLSALGIDIFSYFGKGCRNISKLYVPEGYSFDAFTACNQKYTRLAKHPKYANNYLYQRALMTTLGIDFKDTGFSLLSPQSTLVSPLSVIHFETYRNMDQLKRRLDDDKSKIQCTASADGWYPGSLSFGSLQYPELWDYADNVDTMEFLVNL